MHPIAFSRNGLIGRLISAILLLTITENLRTAAWGDPPAEPRLTDETVGNSINRATQWLKSKRRDDGSWEATDKTDEEYRGGDTALAVLALLYVGEDPRQDEMAKSIAWLANADLKATYTIACRAHALALGGGSKHKSKLEDDLQWLTRNIWSRGVKSMGGYDYRTIPVRQSEGGRYDNSNTQFGVLGAWMSAEAGLRVPQDYWLLVEDHWLRDQNNDGGWGYELGGSSTGAMTAAGLATMYVVLDQAHARDEGRFNGTTTVNCGQYKAATRAIASIETGLSWLGREFTSENPRGSREWKYYYLYAIERAGRASGRKYFRQQDWFRAGGLELLRAQTDEGNWPGAGGAMTEHRNTCFATMFLCHGRAPLFMNKLDHGLDSQNKLRDIASLNRYAEQSFERLLNWQTVALEGDFADLLEAPVLYMSGHESWKFSDSEVQKLREYCLRGGMIFSVACCGDSRFVSGWRELSEAAFPDIRMRPVGEDHPLFNGDVQYVIPEPPQMYEINNGQRTLMLLSTRDICSAWNQNLVSQYEKNFRLGCNVYLYATDKTSFRSRLQSPEIVLEPVEPKRSLRIARLRYSGNWDIEPFGWVRLSRYMSNETATRLLVTSGVELGHDELDRFKIAYMSGSAAFSLSEKEQAGLRKFLTNGGTLLADPAGGSAEFLSSFETQMELLLKTAPRTIASGAPLITGVGLEDAVSLAEVSYRRSARGEAAGEKHARLKVFSIGPRAAVIYAPLDISIGLLGTPVYNCRGYDADSALRIIRNMLLYAGLSTDEKSRLERR